MSEPNGDITNDPSRDETGIVTQSAFDRTAPDANALAKSSTKHRLHVLVFVCLPTGLALLFLAGLVVVGIVRVNEAAYCSSSLCNLKQMALATANVAGQTKTGEIPPAYGEFPEGSGKTGAFFYHLLPYIEQTNLYAAPRDAPVPTYFTRTDRRNPGTDSTISYASNGTWLNGRQPFPKSLNERLSGLILVMERSGLDGAHKWTNTNNYLGTPGAPPPMPQFGAWSSAYLDGSPQSFTSHGCCVGMADGSARVVNQASAIAGWSWACDPSDTRNQPSGW